MSFKIVPTADFRAEFKQLYKKYPSLKKEIEALGVPLESNPAQGTSIGKNCYKIRLSI